MAALGKKKPTLIRVDEERGGGGGCQTLGGSGGDEVLLGLMDFTEQHG